MIVRLHKQARTTPAVRAEIQAASITNGSMSSDFQANITDPCMAILPSVGNTYR